MTSPTADKATYRRAVGIIVFNKQGQVWLGERRGEKSTYRWQFPQGGIDKGETPKQAAFRELREETGLKAKHIEILGRSKGWLYYDFPVDYKGRKSTKGWSGQKQKWYAARLTSKDKHVDLKAHSSKEFSSWRWGELSETPSLIVPFKRKVYERLVIEFAGYAEPEK